MFRFKEVWEDLIYTRKMIWLSLFVFVIGLIIGGTNDSLTDLINKNLEAISGLAQIAEEAENETLAFITIIFVNNAVKCWMVVFLGMFFGLYPIFFLGMNGLVIGYLLKLAGSGQFHLSLFDMVVKGLLPHGILEIPAIIIAGAYGMRLGRVLWKTIYLAIRDKAKLKGIEKTYKGTFKRAVVMCVYLTIILAVASVIESTVTVWLLSL